MGSSPPKKRPQISSDSVEEMLKFRLASALPKTIKGMPMTLRRGWCGPPKCEAIAPCRAPLTRQFFTEQAYEPTNRPMQWSWCFAESAWLRKGQGRILEQNDLLQTGQPSTATARNAYSHEHDWSSPERFWRFSHLKKQPFTVHNCLSLY